MARCHHRQPLPHAGTNRKDAIARLVALIGEAAERPKFRVKTRPSLAARKKRVDAKVQRGETKKLRSGPKPDTSP